MLIPLIVHLSMFNQKNRPLHWLQQRKQELRCQKRVGTQKLSTAWSQCHHQAGDSSRKRSQSWGLLGKVGINVGGPPRNAEEMLTWLEMPVEAKMVLEIHLDFSSLTPFILQLLHIFQTSRKPDDTVALEIGLSGVSVFSYHAFTLEKGEGKK